MPKLTNPILSDEQSFEAPTGDYSRRKAGSSAFSYHCLANAQQLHHRTGLVGPTQHFCVRRSSTPKCSCLRMHVMCGYTALKASFLKFFNQVTKISTPANPFDNHPLRRRLRFAHAKRNCNLDYVPCKTRGFWNSPSRVGALRKMKLLSPFLT